MSDGPKLDWAERLRGTLAAFRFMLGLGGWRNGDSSSQLHDDRTDLAVNRTYLASERTLMGWIRTALSMISFGFTIFKVLETVQKNDPSMNHNGPRNVGLFLIVFGVGPLIVALIQFWRAMRTQAGRSPKQLLSNPAVILAAAIAFFGAFLFVSMIGRLELV